MPVLALTVIVIPVNNLCDFGCVGSKNTETDKQPSERYSLFYVDKSIPLYHYRDKI